MSGSSITPQQKESEESLPNNLKGSHFDYDEKKRFLEPKDIGLDIYSKVKDQYAFFEPKPASHPPGSLEACLAH